MKTRSRGRPALLTSERSISNIPEKCLRDICIQMALHSEFTICPVFFSLSIRWCSLRFALSGFFMSASIQTDIMSDLCSFCPLLCEENGGQHISGQYFRYSQASLRSMFCMTIIWDTVNRLAGRHLLSNKPYPAVLPSHELLSVKSN